MLKLNTGVNKLRVYRFCYKIHFKERGKSPLAWCLVCHSHFFVVTVFVWFGFFFSILIFLIFKFLYSLLSQGYGENWQSNYLPMLNVSFFPPQCSRTCGGGIQKREVLCKQRMADGSFLELPETFCSASKPASQQACKKDDCPSEWLLSDWTEVGCPLDGESKKHE